MGGVMPTAFDQRIPMPAPEKFGQEPTIGQADALDVVMDRRRLERCHFRRINHEILRLCGRAAHDWSRGHYELLLLFWVKASERSKRQAEQWGLENAPDE